MSAPRIALLRNPNCRQILRILAKMLLEHAGAHSDFGMYTLLLCKDPGLQILVDGQWKDLNAGNGSIIVNLGDELRR